MINAIINDATSTKIALLCSSLQVGQVVFWVNSIYDSFIYSDTLAIVVVFMIRTGTRIRTLIKGFGDLYSTIELFPFIKPRKHKPAFYAADLCF
jgi:hypothetical protein